MNHMMWSDEDDNGHLVVGDSDDFLGMRSAMIKRLLRTEPENYGKWQALDVSKSDAHKTYELLNVTMWYKMPESIEEAQRLIKPDLPWAEAHMRERTGGRPINPGVEHANWPYHAGQVELHQHGGKYDHNYMERMWAGQLTVDGPPIDLWHGYRFPVGDLGDVVNQLAGDIGTRQAYLPIFFPEDTGATSGQRVPCTIGYHFIVRDGKLHLQYNIRSCEVYRHFTNDVYMAVRLAQWVRYQLMGRGIELEMGQLTMHMVSFHGFVADEVNIERLANAS